MPPAKRKPAPKPAPKKPTPKAGAPKKPAVNPRTAAAEKIMANDYGYALAFLKSDPELYKVFQEALGPPAWLAPKFQAAVKNTGWYKKHGEAWRTNTALKLTDPETYRQNVGKMHQQVRDATGKLGTQLDAGSLAKISDDAMMFGWDGTQIEAAIKNQKFWKTNTESQRQYKYDKASDPNTFNANLAKAKATVSATAKRMGAVLDPAELDRLANQSMEFGWSEAQLNDNLVAQVESVGGAFAGQAADSYQSIAKTLYRNGVRLSDETMNSYVTAIAAGTQTVSTVEALIRKQAGSLAPGYADELASGIDLYDVAEPYMESMARTLEIGRGDIDLFDPTITGALSARGQDGKPASKTLWEFNQDLRKDTRWKSTQGAQNEVSAVSSKILRDFGLSA